MKTILDKNISQYLADLASDLPAPGGGCAAALSAAQGVALLAMVANLSKETSEITAVKQNCMDQLEEFKSYADRDMEVFNHVMAMMKLPKSNEAEKSLRRQRLDEALIAAASLPVQVMELALQSLDSAEDLIRVGNKNVISDIGIGASHLSMAGCSSKLNVLINLKFISDASLSSGLLQRAESLCKQLEKKSAEILADVESQLAR